jgi:hypothetical protein
MKAYRFWGACMTRVYDLFEKFPDGSSLWRASVSGLGNARIHLHELTRKSNNQFYAIDITEGKTLCLGSEIDVMGFRTPRKSRSQCSEQIA